tara:strand:- start:6445 stop:6963 length:519 start_codon:yes stop_codon:yes gene_type:complete
MLTYSLLSELDRKVILFTYEQRYFHQNHHKKRLFGEVLEEVLNEEYRAFIITEGEYILWELAKRKLLAAEIISHAWLVTSIKNKPFIFNFQENNRLTVDSLFDEGQCEGLWTLDRGILTVVFKYHQHNYDINIIGNNNGLIHSALQIVDNEKADLLKVAPISHAKYGQALLD